MLLRNPVATQKYRNDSRTLLAQGRAELAQGDVRQASEKGWGAAALMLKAIAEQRGWDMARTATCPGWPAGYGQKPATVISTAGTR